MAGSDSKLAKYAAHLEDKVKSLAKHSRDKIAKIEWASQQTMATGIGALGILGGAPTAAYLSNRFISPDHQKAVAAAGGALGLVAVGAAVVEPSAAPYLLALASFLTGPATKLAGDKGAEGYTANSSGGT